MIERGVCISYLVPRALCPGFGASHLHPWVSFWCYHRLQNRNVYLTFFLMRTVVMVYDRGIRNPFITGRWNIKTQGLFYEQVSSVYDPTVECWPACKISCLTFRQLVRKLASDSLFNYKWKFLIWCTWLWVSKRFKGERKTEVLAPILNDFMTSYLGHPLKVAAFSVFP